MSNIYVKGRDDKIAIVHFCSFQIWEVPEDYNIHEIEWAAMLKGMEYIAVNNLYYHTLCTDSSLVFNHITYKKPKSKNLRSFYYDWLELRMKNTDYKLIDKKENIAGWMI